MKTYQLARISRRAALRVWMAGAAPLLLIGALGKTAEAALERSPWASLGDAQGGQSDLSQTSLPSCVITPQQTEGPYFVDERLNRSDIRSDPSDGTVAEGVPLRLALQVSQVSGNACAPLAGAAVDIWHCNALGVYSDVRDRSFVTSGKQFLRGYQVTDENGAVEFATIYPGWYDGRTVHIHFKVRTSPDSASGHELTSQFYFDDALTDQVYARPPYASRGQRTMRNAQDGIYRSGGSQLTLPLSPEGDGYAATFELGLRTEF